jgi:hypothetical protein
MAPAIPTMPLAFCPPLSALSRRMGLPSQPVTLTVAQLDELNRKLSNMRHDINNHLSLIVAAVELSQHKPQMAERVMVTLSEQPAKITNAITKFSAEFERVLGITRS